MDKKLIGKVQTVLGLIGGEELGFTLPHEHLLSDLSPRFQLPSDTISARVRAHQPVCLETLSWIRYHAFENIDNMKVDDEEMVIREALLYKRAGGQTIVDLTSLGLGRDSQALARISRATGLNVIMGAGYYGLDTTAGPELKAKTEEEITDSIVKDIMVGVDGICAGIIGEVAADAFTGAFVDEELKSLCATARAQRATGAPVNIHPGRVEWMPIESLKILGKAGADLSRVVISHLDRTAYSFESMLEMAKTGCYVEFDVFGRIGYYPQRWGVFDRPNDAMRVNYIIRLIDKGYLNQILISTDNCMKTSLVSYGGPGYAHILDNVIPWMRAKGMSEEAIHTITVENPKRLLTFV